MKIYSIFICKDEVDDVKIKSSSFNLSNFSFFERNPIKELFIFAIKSIAPKLKIGIREIIVHEKFLIFSHKWNDGISIFMICDSEYPTRSAFCCINEIYDSLPNNLNLQENLVKNKNEFCVKDLDYYLRKYKNPFESDAIIESQIKVDEACEALHVSLKTFLNRGENLDELLQKSRDLSESSKKLFKTSKKTRKSCCNLQ